MEALYIRQEKTKLEPWLYKISTKGMTGCRNANAAASLESIMKLFYMCPLAQSGVECPVSYQKVSERTKSLQEGEKRYVPFFDRLSLHHLVFSVNSHFESKGLRERDRHFK